MKKIILDCDNTMGLKNRDLDDGLALIYLITHPNAELLAVTTTFGNDRAEVVYDATVELLKQMDSSMTPIRGNELHYQNYMKNSAAHAIVELAHRNRQNISILAVGSMRNLADAYRIDPTITDCLDSVVLMGGTTSPLYFGSKTMKELNFSISPDDASLVLAKYNNISILTGNNCMKVAFGEDEAEMINPDNTIRSHIRDALNSWMSDFHTAYGQKSIILWDILAAVYMMEGESFFIDNSFKYDKSLSNLSNGSLCESMSVDNKFINLPIPSDQNSINHHIISIINGII